jgi:hypothetical protein
VTNIVWFYTKQIPDLRTMVYPQKRKFPPGFENPRGNNLFSASVPKLRQLGHSLTSGGVQSPGYDQEIDDPDLRDSIAISAMNPRSSAFTIL